MYHTIAHPMRIYIISKCLLTQKNIYVFPVNVQSMLYIGSVWLYVFCVRVFMFITRQEKQYLYNYRNRTVFYRVNA